MSKNREAFEAWAKDEVLPPQPSVKRGFLRGHTSATAHYQPLLERLKAEAQGHAIEAKTANVTLKQAKEALSQIASGDYKACGHTAEEVALSALAAINDVTTKGELK